jgi:hypothetical protein
MKDAFVLRLGAESEPERRHFVGWIEEVDTARERRFQSTEELLTFLSECLTDFRLRQETETRRRESQT